MFPVSLVNFPFLSGRVSVGAVLYLPWVLYLLVCTRFNASCFLDLHSLLLSLGAAQYSSFFVSFSFLLPAPLGHAAVDSDVSGRSLFARFRPGRRWQWATGMPSGGCERLASRICVVSSRMLWFRSTLRDVTGSRWGLAGMLENVQCRRPGSRGPPVPPPSSGVRV